MKLRGVALFSILALVGLPVPLALAQQSVPSPSQVTPPDIRPAPGAGTRIILPRFEAGGAIPTAAKTLKFVLTGFNIEGEFDELVEARRALAAPLVGRRITVAQVFEFAAALQSAYVNAGYPLVRVVVTPQELDNRARVDIRVVDGFVERIDGSAIPESVRARVLAVVEKLVRKPRLTQAALERQLLIAGEAPGLDLNAIFSGGKEVGGAVLVLAGRYRPVSLSLYSDNSMPEVFGTGQGVVNASLNSVFGFGEQISVSAAGLPDRDITTQYPTRRYLSATIAAPIGVDGWKFEAGVTQGRTTPRVASVFSTLGQLTQGHVKLTYDLIKRRDTELSLSGRFNAVNETVDSLVFSPSVPLSEDRLRVLRASADGIWRLRQSGTTVGYGATVSRGLNALGARMAADADPLLPLSRAGADAVFTKVDGRFDINQSLPADFFLWLGFNAQTSFNKPLLTSEQFSIVGSRMLSGFNSGSFAGDRGWATRAEFGRAFSLALPSAPTVLTPYLFAATGERILEQPSALEVASVHAANLGGGFRVNILNLGPVPASFYGFVEASKRHSDDPLQQGWQVFLGGSLRY